MSAVTLPKRGRGRQSDAARGHYEEELAAFGAAILQINISGFLRANLADLSDAVGWSPDDLIIDRFGLNFDFIEAQGLTWIDNLETGSGGRLDDPGHADHLKPYVQDYIRRFGVRKVEANALVTRPEAGRELCREAILRYVAENAPERYLEELKPLRDEVGARVLELLAEEFGA